MAETAGPLWKRLLWFLALWLAGVGAVAAVGAVIRWVLL
jgi:hypothetical protein